MDGFQPLTAQEMMCTEAGTSGPSDFAFSLLGALVSLISQGFSGPFLVDWLTNIFLDPIGAIFSYIFGIRL